MNVGKMFFRNKAYTGVYILIIGALLMVMMLSFMIKDYSDYKITNGPGKKDINTGFIVETLDTSKLENLSYVDKIRPLYENASFTFKEEVLSVNYASELSGNEFLVSEFFMNDIEWSNLSIMGNNMEYKGSVKQTGANIFISRELFEKLFPLNIEKYYVNIENYTYQKTFLEYLDKFELIGYLVSSEGIDEINMYAKETKVVNIVIYATLIVTFIFVYFVFKNLIMAENGNIAVFRVLGFNNLHIFKYLFLKALLFLFSTVLILWVVFFLLKLGAGVFISNNVLLAFIKSVFIFKYILLISEIYLLVFLIISIFYSLKISRENITDLYQEVFSS